MNNWKTDFKVKFHLEYHHKDGTKEMDYNSLIVHAEDEDTAKKIMNFIDAIEEDPDVSNVSSNFDISDELMEKL